MTKGNLKKETEGLITAAQDRALRTNAVKAKTEKQQISPLCRMCGLKDETVNHLLCECSKMAQSQYKHRHGNMVSIVHWAIAKELGFEVKEKWYEHELLPVIEKPDLKILWGVTIQTDREIQAQRPDIVIVNRKEGECIVIDIAVPGDANVGEKVKLDKAFKFDWLKDKDRVTPERSSPQISAATKTGAQGLRSWDTT
ncbi:uncharacterized protein LOC125560711 [Nematostella vectensis]|uniref:uncharacterized protein LOC125560711 n=1 Tax=Nematostella vectensis TaxID=45351 RepID=UPI0020774284|nr:uncharacterized protein LOC125560711 [Nematostella vectensis]